MRKRHPRAGWGFSLPIILLRLGDRVGHVHHHKPQAEADVYEPVTQDRGGGGEVVVMTNAAIMPIFIGQ